MKNALLIVLAFVILSFSGFVESAALEDKDIIVVRITDFESPVKLGDFYNFQYYLRDVSGISATVIVDFWIEKDGKEMAFGSDNFFLDSSNRSVQSKIFLPSDLQSGIYTFNIKASHDKFHSESYRTIEIAVKNGIADIKQDGRVNIVLILLILLAIFNVGLVYHIEKEKIGRIFNFREAIATGEVFFERHRFTLLVFSSFLIFGVLIYYLDFAEKLPKTFAYAGYFILGVLAVLMLARVVYDKFFSDKFAGTISDEWIEREGTPLAIPIRIGKKQSIAPEEKKQNEKAKKWGMRFKNVNDWLMGDVKSGSKKDNAVLKNEKKVSKNHIQKVLQKRKEDRDSRDFI